MKRRVMEGSLELDLEASEFKLPFFLDKNPTINYISTEPGNKENYRETKNCQCEEAFLSQKK